MPDINNKPSVTDAGGEPRIGELFYDGLNFIFQQMEDGPVIFAEIRGYGSGLPLDANARQLCKLWNAAHAPSLAVDAEVVLPELPKEVSVFGFGDLYPKEATDEYAAKLLWRIGSQMRELQQLRKQLKAFDAVIDEEGIAQSRINPLEDLRIGIRKLKQRAGTAESEIARMKAGK